MCGIAGIYNFNNKQIDTNVLMRMTEIQKHRGPDDYGYVLFDIQKQKAISFKEEYGPFFDFKPTVGFGHRRLSIIDLSASGHQPMYNEDRTIWITYNGEIYNYLELFSQLTEKGHIFRSRTDTEVILHAYEEWGFSCLNKFNGMWAFALWDENKKTLFCSRDRFGIKPFYYFLDKDKFVFASEIKAILENKDIPKIVNQKVIFHYLVKGYGYVDTNDETFFLGIKQLEPAHYLLISRENLEYKRYWSLTPDYKNDDLDIKKAEENLLFLLQDSIRLNLRSDVPLGLALSGGIDSSTLAVLIPKLTNSFIETFSACFNEIGYDERNYIEETLKNKKLISNFIFPDANSLINEFGKIIWHQDEPYSGASVFSQWEIMKKAKERHIKVLLTGQGGDEILAGYYKYYPYYFMDLFTNFKWVSAIKILIGLRPMNGFSKKEAVLSILKIIVSNSCLKKIKNNQNKRFLFKPTFLNQDFFKKNKCPNNNYSNNFSSFLDNELYNSLTVSPLPSLLHIDDRNSMAHSIESRPPFLDHRLVEFLFSLPYNMKISDGYTKYILREALKGTLPEKIRQRRDKMGFVIPIKVWFKEQLKNKLLEILNSPNFKKRGIFEEKGINKILDLHFLGKRDFSFTIWSWFNLELWFREFIDG